MNEGAGVVSYLQPTADLELMRALVDRKITAFSLGPVAQDHAGPVDGRALVPGARLRATGPCCSRPSSSPSSSPST